ncbi:uncharacterized protein LY89DRAFT_785192 [Mollisia scopiformis]|uniref:2EXR domain-containing protein n=1 Tax=Mollisia scopiformis TaxID=149040 RepID=A0A194WZZ3_MOLSC|nr:uncharacterized protein LY89DRAFT_785192 [Mollisia scopiformis]KUJ13518.1 hypothetical protein LY89DRAFT_785192 [Mollisia scopiformis]
MSELSDSSTSAMTEAPSGKTFTVFDKLPIEIRLEIWKESIPEGRVVAVTDRRARLEGWGGSFDGFRAQISARWTVPAVMQVCQESRNEVKKTYTYILKDQLGFAVPFNFQHDTLLMDGPDGTVSMWSFEKAGRNDENCRKELAMIHANLKHLAIQGQRLLPRTLNEVQQFTNLETLVLPSNPFWNAPEGHDAFNLRISERLRLTWSQLKQEGDIKDVKLRSGEDSVNDGKSGTTRQSVAKSFAVPSFAHYFEPIFGDNSDYSKIQSHPEVKFMVEKDLRVHLAAGTNVTVSYIDSADHPAAKEARRRISTSDDDPEAMTPKSFSDIFSPLPPPTTRYPAAMVELDEFLLRLSRFCVVHRKPPNTQQILSLWNVRSPIATSLRHIHIGPDDPRLMKLQNRSLQDLTRH